MGCGQSSLSRVRPVSEEFVGLKNDGATCSLNTLVQALFMLPEFRASLDAPGVSGATDAPLTKALRELFLAMQGPRAVASTAALRRALGWGPVNRQHDLHDVWLRFFDKLEDEFKTVGQTEMLQSIFNGTQHNYVTCSGCGHTSEIDDGFSSLELEVSHEAEGSNVQAALRALLHPEELKGDARYHCDRCACKRDATRGIKLQKMPQVLTLHLKRYRMGGRTRKPRIVKLCSPLTFDTELDVGDLMPEHAQGHNFSYRLHAALVHKGTATSGHYYGLIQHAESGRWQIFNDEQVLRVGSNLRAELMRAHGGNEKAYAAYMLIYRRVEGQSDEKQLREQEVGEQEVEVCQKCGDCSDEVRDLSPAASHVVAAIAE